MKKILTQYLWIFVTLLILTVITISLFPDKKNRLEFIEEKIKEVEEKGTHSKRDRIRETSHRKRLGTSG